MDSATLNTLLFISNVSALVGNTLTLSIYLYTATQTPKIYGLWFYVFGFPIYLLMSLLNLLTSFGTSTLFQIIPKEIFQPLYFISLAALPFGVILMVTGSFLIARFLLTSKFRAEQGAAANP